MTNLWSFLLQTAAVSLTAALLLFVKWLLRDKLSPRWQYGIWGVLALRILIPAGISRNILPNLGIWLETAKGITEKALDSAYTDIYRPTTMNHILPRLTGEPGSVTDWLFAGYALGVLLWGGWYLISYIRLRLRLRRGTEAAPAIREQIANVRLRHWLKPWRCVEIEGISSPFVCGVFRPVLAVPAGQEVEEMVLLHELLHLQYRDALQSVFWTALRCLHWCNPFMQYTFNRIGNDMESLCDQRVLERLEGEERREYGRLLLTMANQRYARAPGTTSISNGGRNIARRIEAIARFKRYPRGMALVSVCIGICLLSPTLFGTAAAVSTDAYQPAVTNRLSYAMAASRVRRCTTVAGAIDTYAKGILFGNGLYIATASPLEKHAALEAEMLGDHLHDGSDLWRVDPGYGLEYLDTGRGYNIYDLIKQADGSYTCFIAFCVTDFADPAHQNWPTDTNGVEIVEGAVILPLHIFREEDAWVVEERDERILANIRFDQLEFYGDDLPWLLQKTVECETGTITISHRITCEINDYINDNSLFGSSNVIVRLQDSINPDAQFSSGWVKYHYQYRMDPDSPVQPQRTAALNIAELETPEEIPDFGDFSHYDPYTEVSGSTNTGSSFHRVEVGKDWDGRMESGGGHWLAGEQLEGGEFLSMLPAKYAFRIIFDGDVAEEIVIGGFSND